MLALCVLIYFHDSTFELRGKYESPHFIWNRIQLPNERLGVGGNRNLQDSILRTKTLRKKLYLERENRKKGDIYVSANPSRDYIH